MNKFL
jgi:dipeptidyl aminopeptidase/acylaminoacyl peptidase